MNYSESILRGGLTGTRFALIVCWRRVGLPAGTGYPVLVYATRSSKGYNRMANASQETTGRSGPEPGASNPRLGELDSIQQRLLSDPSNLRGLTQAGILLYEMGRFEESAAHLARAMSAPKHPARTQHDPPQQNLADVHSCILVQMGDFYAGSSDGALAERHYRAAIALSPNHAAPYVGLGTMALQTGQLEQAADFFETAVELQDDYAEA